MSSVIYSGKYEVQELIAQGGMGAVYKALDQKLNRIVALKVVHPHLSGDPSFLNRFLREARDMARLPHENIVTIFSVEQDQDTHYLVMEYFPGTNLRDMINSDGAAPLWKAVNITRQIANALSYAHHHGIIHRDIKPANVLIGTDNRAKLTDFGIAAALDHAPLTSTGQIIGSLPYMPPEQARDATLDGRSDLYSLGMTFYELLTGANPRRNLSNTAILGMLLSEDKVPQLEFPGSIPSEIQEVIKDLLRYRPTDRIQSADLLLERLEALRSIWSSSSSGERASEDAPTIIKSISNITSTSGSKSDDKTVAVLDPRLASRSSAPVSQKPVAPQRKVNRERLIYAASLVILLLAFGIGGYYFFLNPTLNEETRSTVAVIPLPAPQKDSNEVSRKDKKDNSQGDGQDASVQTSRNQPPSETDDQAKTANHLNQKSDIKEKTSTQISPSSKTPSQGTMPRQKSTKTVDKATTNNTGVIQKTPPSDKPPEQDTKAGKQPSTDKTPPVTMPEQKSKETDKAPTDTIAGEQTDTKVAAAVKSAAETQALMDLLEKLRSGIAGKDLPAVERLSTLSENRRRFLETIFENYSSIDLAIGEVSPGPTEAKAVLFINKLVLPSGESIDPAPLVRRTPVTIPRDGDNWGRVIW